MDATLYLYSTLTKMLAAMGCTLRDLRDDEDDQPGRVTA